MNSPVFERNVTMLEASLGDELMALDVKKGACFGFNSTAAAVWSELERSATFEQLHSALVDQFEVDAELCSSELKQLLDDLIARGLVRERREPKSGCQNGGPAS